MLLMLVVVIDAVMLWSRPVGRRASEGEI